LLLGDARSRRHEIAVRTALGGSRWRIFRELLVEHVMLAVVAASAGLLLALWFTPLLVSIAPGALPRLDAVVVDARIGAFAFVVGGLTVLLFGLAPAATLARTPTRQVLAEGARDGAPARHLGQRVVVAAEIALALVLLVGASLFGESIYRLTSRPLGFDPSELAVVTFTWTGDQTGGRAAELRARAKEAGMDRSSWIREFEEIRRTTISNNITTALARLDALPGVVAAGGVSEVPFAAAPVHYFARAERQPPTENQRVQRQIVTDGYFEAMRLPILRGRNFDSRDRQGRPSLAVVSREMERRFFDGNAVGKRLIMAIGTSETTLEVIGVVPDVKQREFSDEDAAAFYLLDWQQPGVKHLLVRSSTDAARLLPRLRETIRDYDAQMVITALTTMSGLVAESIAEERLRAMLSGLFGGAGLLLAAIGLYGLAARRVIDRRREIGVRIALGASARDVRVIVFVDALKTVAIGLVLGVPAAFTASQVVRTLLYGVSPTAPHVFAIAAATLALAAVAATLLPASRAARTDPMIVLRE
jgi:putative ABC transport system permease protein